MNRFLSDGGQKQHLFLGYCSHIWWGEWFLPHPGARVISAITGEHVCPPPRAVRSYLKAFWLNSLSFGLCQSKQLPNLKLLLVNKQQNPCRPSRTSGNLQKTDFPQALLSDADRVLGWETTWKARLWPWRTVVGAASKRWVDIPAPLTAERERQRQSGNVLSNDGEDDAGPARALMQGDRWTPLELYNLQS